MPVGSLYMTTAEEARLKKKQMLFVGTAIILLMTSGCQKKASGQVVAVVNGDEITQQELNADIQGASIPAGADKKKVMAQALQGLVERKLLVQQAKADGIDKSPEYLNQVRRAQDELLLRMLAAKTGKNVSMPDDAAVSKFIADNPTMFSGRKKYALDQLAFPMSADPKAVQELEPAHTLDAIAAVLSAHNIPFVRAKGQLDSAAVPSDTAQKIAALPAGEPFIVPQNGRYIASVVTGVTAQPTPDEQAKPAAVNMLRQKALSELMKARLDSARTSAKIDYAQGFAPPAK